MRREPTPAHPNDLVKFPHDLEEYTNTGEGGMYVKLAVVGDLRKQCSMTAVQDIYPDVLVGSDRALGEGCTEFFYPGVKRWMRASSSPTPDWQDLLSIPLQALIILGSTGWSGWSDSRSSYWTCQFADLTLAGQALYRMLQDQFPYHQLHLLTYLDT